MIVVTGPGRSGTSLIADVYRQCGFPVGGELSVEINAGYEDPKVVALNVQACEALGISLVGRRHDVDAEKLLGRQATAVAKTLLPSSIRRGMRTSIDRSPLRRRPFRGIPWVSAQEVLEAHGPAMRELADRLLVAKDPQFVYTLPFWIDAAANIECVVLAVRDCDEMVESRERAGHIGRSERLRANSRNSFIFGIGNVLVAAWDAGIPVEIVRFPDDYSDPCLLAQRLPSIARFGADAEQVIASTFAR